MKVAQVQRDEFTANPLRDFPAYVIICNLAVRAIFPSKKIATPEPQRETAPAPIVEATSSSPTQAPAQLTTIDPQIQALVEQEIERMNTEWSPCAAIILVLDPHTGNVLAAAYRGGTEATAQLAAVRPMVAGSTTCTTRPNVSVVTVVEDWSPSSLQMIDTT